MIYVFKTSVKTKSQLKKLKPHLDKILHQAKWNFDLQDCDKILRIETSENIVVPVTNLLKINNFNCEEFE